MLAESPRVRIEPLVAERPTPTRSPACDATASYFAATTSNAMLLGNSGDASTPRSTRRTTPTLRRSERHPCTRARASAIARCAAGAGRTPPPAIANANDLGAPCEPRFARAGAVTTRTASRTGSPRAPRRAVINAPADAREHASSHARERVVAVRRRHRRHLPEPSRSRRRRLPLAVFRPRHSYSHAHAPIVPPLHARRNFSSRCSWLPRRRPALREGEAEAS